MFRLCSSVPQFLQFNKVPKTLQLLAVYNGLIKLVTSAAHRY